METDNSEDATLETQKEEENQIEPEDQKKPNEPEEESPILEMPDLTPEVPEAPAEPITEIINEIIICESLEDQVQECPITEGKIIKVELKEQLSESSCSKGFSWENTDSLIRVEDGCRAEFDVEIEITKN